MGKKPSGTWSVIDRWAVWEGLIDAFAEIIRQIYLQCQRSRPSRQRNLRESVQFRVRQLGKRCEVETGEKIEKIYLYRMNFLKSDAREIFCVFFCLCKKSLERPILENPILYKRMFLFFYPVSTSPRTR